MVALLLLPVVLSLLVLAAHFLRSGNIALVVLVLAFGALLAVRRSWAARLIQVGLVLGALEWVRTLAQLVAWRTQAGQPVARMVMILGAVTLVTLFSALVFRSARLRRWYGMETTRTA